MRLLTLRCKEHPHAEVTVTHDDDCSYACCTECYHKFRTDFNPDHEAEEAPQHRFNSNGQRVHTEAFLEAQL